ncbi:MAG: hypothetical protein R3C53_14235 [Pirellulaceae bacterium]
MHGDRIPDDQAQLLRRLAEPSRDINDLVNSPAARAAITQGQPSDPRIANAPHVVLVSELPSLNGGLVLALQMAQEMALQARGADLASGSATLLADLAPAASRLPAVLADQHGLMHAESQPMWQASSHGRTLAKWTKGQAHQLTVVAQPAGEFPTVEQFPRLCEQLIRHIAGKGREHGPGTDVYRNVFMLSECVGLPLDASCWRAADVILLLHDVAADAEQLHSLVSARLPKPTQGQRVILMRKELPRLRTWSSRRRIESRSDVPSDLERVLPHAEYFSICWPQYHRKLARSMRSTARDLVGLVAGNAGAQGRPNRQAS